MSRPVIIFLVLGLALLVYSLIDRRRFLSGLIASGSVLGLAVALLVLGPDRVWTNSFVFGYAIAVIVASSAAVIYYVRKDSSQELGNRRRGLVKMYGAGGILIAVGIIGYLAKLDFTQGFIFGGLLLILLGIPEYLIVRKLEKQRSVMPKSVGS